MKRVEHHIIGPEYTDSNLKCQRNSFQLTEGDIHTVKLSQWDPH